MTVRVSDVGSNYEENLQRWARALGTGEIKRKIFLTIYSTRKTQWTAPEIAAKTGLDTKTIASAGKQMSVKGLFEQIQGSRVIYQKIDDVHHAKKAILRLAGNVNARESMPTKRGTQKGSVIHMAKVTNRFENVGVANTGRMSGRITGNSQKNVANESAAALIEAFRAFEQALGKDRTLSLEQKEDALSAAQQLEEEVRKPESAWSLSKVRNSVAALKTLSNGAQALHALYQQIHPLLVGHFHLLS